MNIRGLIKVINSSLKQLQNCLSLGLVVLLSSLFLFAGTTPVFAQGTGTAVNTAINNQAKADYSDAASGRAATLNSNTVSTIVGKQTLFSLTASQNKVSAPGSNVRFQHALTNLGNATESFNLSLQNNYPGTFAFTNVQLFLDANSDGVPDSTTPISGPLVLQAGETIQFIALAQVPTAATTGQEDRFVVIAGPTSGSAPNQVNTDTVIITNQAVITVNKSFNVTQGPSPYNDLLVTLTYTNIGSSTASNVVLTDVIGAANASPAYDTSGLQYIANSGTWQTQAVSDANGGDPAGVNYQVSTVGTVSTITATIANVTPNSTGMITFKVNVKAGLLAGIAKTTNVAAITYFDGLGPQSTISNNSAFYRVLPSGADLVLSKTHTGDFIVGNDGTFNLVVSNIGGGPTVGPITVEDQMPAGLIVNAATLPNGSVGGTAGWTCTNPSPQFIRCTSSASIPSGQNHPTLLQIKARASAITAGTPLLNRATVSGGSEAAQYGANNAATDSVQVIGGATVSGSAWFDTNHNGRRDANEPPARGILVELVDVNGKVIAKTTTANDGTYSLTNLPPGVGYSILFRFPDGSSALASSPVNGEQGQLNPASNATISKGIIEGLTLVAGANITQQSLRLDPTGVVYDSVTRLPVAGAVVRIVGPAGFDPQKHLVGGVANATQVTGASGIYQFIFLDGTPPGVYSLDISAPSTYFNGVSPTIRPATSKNCSTPACLDPTGLAARGSTYSVQPANIYTAPPLGQDTTYYTSFYLDITTDPDVINNHIPLDPIGLEQAGLFIEKTANRASAEIGDTVVYTVRISNRSAQTLSGLSMTDVLPFGFKYIAGSARIGAPSGSQTTSQQISEPPLIQNRTFIIRGIPDLLPDSTTVLTYLTTLVPGAQDGDGINRVQAKAGNTQSNVAIAKVRVSAGIFTTRGIVLGKVFVDCNSNHVQDRDEIGIPGVRLYLQDGTNVITDSEGKFSLAGLAARTHALKIDEQTLPIGARMASSNNRNAGIGESRFVDLKNGELHRADFSEMSCTPAVLDQVKARRKKAEGFSIEAERLLANKLEASGKVNAPADPRALPASGVIGGTVGTSVSPSLGSTTRATDAPAPQAAKPAIEAAVIANIAAKESATKILIDADNTLAFIDLKDGDTLPIAQANIRLKGSLGATLTLQVNGKTIGEQRIGTKSENPERQTQLLDYVGVTMQAGKNTVTIRQADSFGNARGEQTITLIAPDQAGQLLIELPQNNPVADGVSLTKIKVNITDQAGVPVTARTPVTLEISHGRFKVEDVNRNEPGIQTFVVNGVAEFEIEPPLDPIEAKIKITSGTMQVEKRLYFLPELRPLIANGIIEGVINVKRFSGSQLVGARTGDEFEQSLQRFSKESADGQRKAASAAAFYLKGKVKGEYLLTLAYDSEKDTRERLFRDIQPDEYYPVYGDSSIKGFDAQSTSHLYVRVDHNKSWLLWGDFSTGASNPQQRLAQYQRSLTGLKHHYENNGIVIDSFASRDTVRQIVKELATNGTSGPYEFSLGDALINSERVELIVRDRNQPALIIKSTTLTRFVDYGFEPLSGRLLLRSPAPSVDANLNPISLRITAEINQGGDPFWVAGLSANAAINKTISVGGSLVINKNPIPENFARLASINTQIQITDQTIVSAEFAQTKRSDGLQGNAARIEALHEIERLKLKFSAAKADVTFDNPAAPVNKGRLEIGARADYEVIKGTRLLAEAIVSKDTATGAKREGALIGVEQTFGEAIKLELGVRAAKEQAATNLNNQTIAAAPVIPDSKSTSLRAKLSTPVPFANDASVYVELEQDIRDTGKRLIAVGGDYHFAGRGKIYARHEFESSLPGGFALTNTATRNTSLVGISTDYMENGSLFTEYRGRDSFGLRTTEAAVGLKNLFTLTDGLRLNTNVERVKAISGARDQESSSVALGLDYTASERWKGSTRLEWRDGTSSKSWLQTADGAFKLNRDWTGLARHIWNSTDTKTQGQSIAGNKVQQRLQVGAAWRQTDINQWNALGLAEIKREKDSATSAEVAARRVAIISTHANWQPNNNWVVSGQYGTKWVRENILGDLHKSQADRVSARATWDFAKGWDASAMASVLRDRASGVAQKGIGLELGYQVKTNLWMSLGYNFSGYTDKDFIGGQSTQKGIFLRLRFKFDEHSLTSIPTE